MDTNLIIISEYCRHSRIEPSFILSLEEGGLIEVETIDSVQYISVEQLHKVERYSHFYYDLSINIEGIDAIRHMLNRIEKLQAELKRLQDQLHVLQQFDNRSMNG